MPPAKQPQPTQQQPLRDSTLEGVLDRLGHLSVSLYAAQQSNRELTAELDQARAEIEALTASNEALSQQVSQQPPAGDGA